MVITWKSRAQPERPQMAIHCGDGELDVLADTTEGGRVVCVHKTSLTIGRHLAPTCDFSMTSLEAQNV